MSFYVTIPSDSSMDVFKLNTQSNFSVLLKEDIQFNVDYEVALVEMNYHQAVKHNIGKIKFIGNKQTIVKDLEVYDGETLKNFHNRLDSMLKDLLKSDQLKIIPLLKDNTIELLVDTAGLKVDFEGNSLDELATISSSNKSVFIKFKSEVIRVLDSFFIYCNIVDQCIGNTFGKLLRIVNSVGKYGENQSISYDNPHYIPVEQTNFRKININIRDFLGNFVQFDNKLTRIIIKLHFRPKRYF